MKYLKIYYVALGALWAATGQAQDSQALDEIYSQPLWVEAGTMAWFAEHASKRTQFNDAPLMETISGVGGFDTQRVLIVPRAMLDGKSYLDVWKDNDVGEDDLVMFLTREEREDSRAFVFGDAGTYDFKALGETLMGDEYDVPKYASSAEAQAALGYSGFVAEGLLSRLPDGGKTSAQINGLANSIPEGSDKWCMPPWIKCK